MAVGVVVGVVGVWLGLWCSSISRKTGGRPGGTKAREERGSWECADYFVGRRGAVGRVRGELGECVG